MYKFTIIIPHYNLSDSLPTLLKTIPLRDDVQVIVVDDGSQDYHISKLQKIKTKFNNITIILTNKNQGSGAARNIGLKYALGEYIIFADADDFFTDNAYSIWTTSIEEEVDIVYFAVNCLQYNSSIFSNRLKEREKTINRLRKGNVNQLYRWLRYCYTEPWGKIFNRKFLMESGEDFECSIVANDYRFSVKTGLKANRIKYVNKSFYNYTIRTGSLSNKQSDTIEKILARMEVYYGVQKIFKENKVFLRPFDRYVNSLNKEILKNYRISAYLKGRRWIGISKYYRIISSSISVLLIRLCSILKIPYCGF